MFSNIQDSACLSEKLSQRDLLFVLTRFFSVMTRIVELFDGVVGEIMTEPPGLLVFWNTPLSVEDHAAKACAAALAQQNAVFLLNTEFAQLDLLHLKVSVGLHTGPVMTGNIGSEQKMKFGCLGDPMNLASRLAGLCKLYGVGVISSAATHSALPDLFLCRKLDLVKVKGRMEPTTIYEVVRREKFTHADVLVPESAAMARGFNDISPYMFQHGGHQIDVESQHSHGMGGEGRPTNSAGASDPWQRLRCLHGSFSRWLWHKPRDSVVRAPTVAPLAFRRNILISSAVGSLTTPAAGHDDDFNEVGDTFARRAQIQKYEAALAEFQAAKFAEACSMLKELLAEHPGDLAATRLHKRAWRHVGPRGVIDGLTEEDIRDWTGVLNMVGK